MGKNILSKNIMSPLLGLILLIIMTGTVHGLQLKLGIEAGTAIPGQSQHTAGLLLGANLEMKISKTFSVQLNGRRFQNDVTARENSLNNGKLTTIPVQLSIVAGFKVGEKIRPYILTGIGYYFYHFKLDDSGWTDVNFQVEEKIDNGLGFHLGAGIDYQLSTKFSLNADIRYCICKRDGTWTMTDEVSGTAASGKMTGLNMNHLMVAAGLKFNF